MFRFVIMAFLLLLIGAGVLSLFSIQEADRLAIYVAGSLVAIAVLKLVLDLILHQKKRDEDQDSFSRVLQEPSVKTYYDIDRFVEAQRRRKKRRKRA